MAAIVTGAASGIGQATAIELVKRGLALGLFDRANLQCTCEGIRDCVPGCEIVTVQGDVSDPHDVDRGFEYLHKSFGKPATVLVNSAGITKDNWIWKLDVEDWDQVQQVNLKGTFLCTKRFSQQFIQGKAQNGSIVNIASIIAKCGNIGQTNYVWNNVVKIMLIVRRHPRQESLVSPKVPHWNWPSTRYE